MDYLDIENKYLTYYKFFDGIDIEDDKKGGIGCDLSFNGGVTAGYLLSRKDLSKVYLPYDSYLGIDGMFTMDMSQGLLKALGGIECDYIISIGGVFNFLPIDEIARGIYNSLLPDGRFLFGVYPQIIDDNGRDLLETFSRETKVNVSKKLNRMTSSICISFGRYFPEITTSYTITDTTADEIKDYFLTTIAYEFKNLNEFNTFFSRLNDFSRLYMVWQIISGRKI